MVQSGSPKHIKSLAHSSSAPVSYTHLDVYKRQVINRISGDTTTLNDFMLRISQEVIVQFCLMVGIIVIMLVMNWKLTLLSLIPIPFVVIGSRKFGRMIAPYSVSYTHLDVYKRQIIQMVV